MRGPGGAVQRVRLRSVPLWGRLVLVDETGTVWCSAHHVLHSTAELSSPHSTCPEGLVRGGGGGIRPMAGADDDEQPSPPSWAAQW
ncbi:hypothetical protein [Kineococcus terrestris]|uniref:hypothetical protein n=1 Tax=Kineococcus terrestris TaxID=2044856 RepID=UPI0034DB6CDF